MIVAGISSAIAATIIEKRLRDGGSIIFPSGDTTMLNWKDTSIGDHTSFQAYAGAVCLILIWDQERGWKTRCEPFLGFWPRDLDTSDLDEAKRSAENMLRLELKRSLDAL
jgi:hypothetical protein